MIKLMSYKIYSFIFACLPGLQVNYQTRQASENIPDYPLNKQQKQVH